MGRRLTDHYTIEALTTTGRHPGLSNDPTPEERVNLLKVAQKLEMLNTLLSEAWGSVVVLCTSYGLRHPELNEACGGSLTSAHLEGLAVDILPPDGKTPGDIQVVLWASPTFMSDVDQVILERGCLHLGLPCKASSYKARRQLLQDGWVDGVRKYSVKDTWKPSKKGAC